MCEKNKKKPHNAQKPSEKCTKKGKNFDKSKNGKKCKSPNGKCYRRRRDSTEAPTAKQCGMEEYDEIWSDWESCSEGEPEECEDEPEKEEDTQSTQAQKAQVQGFDMD